MEQYYFTREQLLENVELPIDHEDNQRAWQQIISSMANERYPVFCVLEIKEIFRSVGCRGLYKAFQTRCKNFADNEHPAIYDLISRLLPDFKGYLALLSFKYASDENVREFFYKKIMHTYTSDDLLIEQIPLQLLKLSDRNDSYIASAQRRIKNLAQRTTVYAELAEYLADFAQINLPMTLKTAEIVMKAAGNKENLRLLMPLLRDCYIDYPGSRQEIAKTLLSICRNFDHSHHWRLNDIKEVASFLILAHEEKDSALATRLTGILFQALRDIAYQPVTFVLPLINRVISFIRSHYQMTALQSLNENVDQESPLYRELNILLAV